jgi:hypothetical protein
MLSVLFAAAWFAPAHATEHKLLSDDGLSNDYFGWSVSISGDYAVIGAFRADANGPDTGVAYIFYRNQGGADNWGQQAKLAADDGTTTDRFGYSVSISGDYAIIGAQLNDDNGMSSGSAYIFYRNQGGTDNWGQQVKLLPDDGAAYDQFGYSVSIRGDYAIVGAYLDDDNADDSGSVYIFYRNQGGTDNWGQYTKLTADDAEEDDYFGYSVSLSADYAIVGAALDDDRGAESGSAYIFYRNQGGADNWGQQAKLTAADGADTDRFGYSVSISGDYVVVGAQLDDDNGSNSGSAYIFNRSGSNWTQQDKLTASNGAADDFFGESVSISGDYAFVGAHQHDSNGLNSGAAYIFARNGSTWAEWARPLASDVAPEDYFGYSVSISGDDVLVGAYWDDDNGSNSGSAYFFPGCFLVADLNGDCNVDWLDAEILAAQWLETGNPGNCPWAADTSGDDCLVNLRDYRILAGQWLQ